MTKEELYAHPGWRWCTSQGSRDHTLILGIKSTFLEKIQWLEEMEDLNLKMKASREKGKKQDSSIAG